MKRIIILIAIGFLCSISLRAQVTKLTPAAFSEALKKVESPVIIDVRTPAEFDEGKIEGARNINVYDPNFLESFAEYDKATPVYLYCRSGARSASAAAKLKALGFQTVYDLAGGYIGWMQTFGKH
jgi:rhodanese-related sulfurtransferase